MDTDEHLIAETALASRALGASGQSDMVWGHVSVRDPELGRRLAHPEQPVPLQHQQQLKHVVNRLHWIGRRSLVPHHRTISR